MTANTSMEEKAIGNLPEFEYGEFSGGVEFPIYVDKTELTYFTNSRPRSPTQSRWPTTRRKTTYYTVIAALDIRKGYADLVYLPMDQSQPALLVELKCRQDTESAIDQILRRDYPLRLEKYQGNLILVGISYDASADPKAPDFKHHSCRLLRG